MASPRISIDTYTDIAVSMSIQNDGSSRSSQTPRAQLKQEWNNRIQGWQGEYEARCLEVKNHETLEDFQFSTFFIQHPIPAVLLRNVFEIFYTLDELMFSSKKQQHDDKLARWKELPLFEYLATEEVQKTWTPCIQHLASELTQGSHNDVHLKHINGMFSNIERLGEAYDDLQRGFNEHLKDFKLRVIILERIHEAVSTRIAMIDQYLKLDERQQKPDDTLASKDNTALGIEPFDP